jgi:hypothetical protein
MIGLDSPEPVRQKLEKQLAISKLSTFTGERKLLLANTIAFPDSECQKPSFMNKSHSYRVFSVSPAVSFARTGSRPQSRAVQPRNSRTELRDIRIESVDSDHSVDYVAT